MLIAGGATLRDPNFFAELKSSENEKSEIAEWKSSENEKSEIEEKKDTKLSEK